MKTWHGQEIPLCNTKFFIKFRKKMEFSDPNPRFVFVRKGTLLTDVWHQWERCEPFLPRCGPESDEETHDKAPPCPWPSLSSERETPTAKVSPDWVRTLVGPPGNRRSSPTTKRRRIKECHLLLTVIEHLLRMSWNDCLKVKSDLVRLCEIRY